MKAIILIIIFIFCHICFVVTSAIAADDVNIKKVSSETEDLVRFQISVPKTITHGEDIDIAYIVENKGRKPVYLITRPFAPEVKVKELWILEILSPLIMANSHFEYDYEFVKILPKKSYRGKLTIKAETYLSDTKYSFENAAIQASFSYLVDITALSEFGDICRKYSLPCLTEVDKKAKSITLGNLVISLNPRRNSI